jgi:hypothetical protein
LNAFAWIAFIALHLLHYIYCMDCINAEFGRDEFGSTEDKREAHARIMLQKMAAQDNEKQRLWRWALRGIVIQ